MNLSDRNYTTLPGTVFEQPDLEELYLNHNLLETLPAGSAG